MSIPATAENIAELRAMLGETLAAGEPESSSLFTNEQLTRWLESSVHINQAALRGWQVKSAHFANLVTTVDGAAVRQLSDLHKNAISMVRMYSGIEFGATSSRSRVGKIVRP